ncbi:hypothetical protein ALI144C_08790 [Actinosynnema sp. ALI-1.44]|nr:hypothetical protein ALI144C_08790 [Actinosynnema sp. ALI-1.44]
MAAGEDGVLPERTDTQRCLDLGVGVSEPTTAARQGRHDLPEFRLGHVDEFAHEAMMASAYRPADAGRGRMIES